MSTYHRSEDEWKELLKTITHRPIPKDGRESMYSSSHYTVTTLINCGVIRKLPQTEYDVVDIGCGNGRLAIALAEMDYRYLGMEAVSGCIEWAQKAFEPWKNISFMHLDVYNPSYNPHGRLLAENIRLTLADSCASSVILNSVFTHFESITQCSVYLEEVYRILVPRGRAWVTWFRSPPNPIPDVINTDRAVFLESDIVDIIEDKGFSIISSYGGNTERFSDQWQMVIAKMPQ